MEATTPRERPILFSAPMVRALLAGTKTQTRRVVKPQPTDADWDACRANLGGDTHKAYPWVHPLFGIGLRRDAMLPDSGIGFPDQNTPCPYGRAGDRLWVRETAAIERWTREFGDEPPLPTDRPWKQLTDPEGDDVWYWPHYRATDPAPDLSCERDGCRVCDSGAPGPHWSPSIHMPRWACRIVLEITDVRVERLHEIGEDAARAEGVELNTYFPERWSPEDGWLNYDYPPDYDGEDYEWCATARDSFASLWRSINGAGSWDANPWVWVLTFKRAT